MTSTWNPPSTAQVGEEIDLEVEFCSPADTGTDHDVKVDGTPIISESVVDFADQMCFDRNVGEFHDQSDVNQFESDSSVEASNGNLIFTQPGEYTLSIEDYHLSETQSITIEDSFTGGLSLSLKSGIDSKYCGDETVEAVFEATSDAKYGGGTATIVTNNLITGNSASESIEVGGNETKEVTASIDIPEDTVVNGENIISVNVQ